MSQEGFLKVDAWAVSSENRAMAENIQSKNEYSNFCSTLNNLNAIKSGVVPQKNFCIDCGNTTTMNPVKITDNTSKKNELINTLGEMAEIAVTEKVNSVGKKLLREALGKNVANVLSATNAFGNLGRATTTKNVENLSVLASGIGSVAAKATAGTAVGGAVASGAALLSSIATPMVATGTAINIGRSIWKKLFK